MTVREEDSLNVEGAYLEGWAFDLRAEALRESPVEVTEDMEGFERLTADECLSESMQSLYECAKLFEEQEYEDDGIGKHVAELLAALEEKGVKPAEPEDEEEDGEDNGNGSWEDGEGDVKMA